MNQGLSINPKLLTVQAQQRRAHARYAFAMLSFLLIAAVQAYSLGAFPYTLTPASVIAWLCLFFCVAAILYHPRNGVYIIVGLSLAGDASLTPWYPFTKNFSSAESLLYFSDSFSFSPFEIILALTFAVWILRMAFQRKWEIRLTLLLAPLSLFTAFAAFALVYGIGRHGDRTVGLWEARAIFYILPVYLLASNLLTKREHISMLLWMIIIPNIIDGIFGTLYVATSLKFNLSGVESIGEHSMSVHFNAFFVLLVGSWIYQTSPMKRGALLLGLPFVLLSYIANNRRAAFIAMALALIVVGMALYRTDRKRFWLIVPPVALVAMAYLAVFWNAGGALGGPAKAIRSVIGKPDPRDAASNMYRVLENINIMYTIRSSPLLGVGFGQKFRIIVPMPDISFFIWWQYITHNSVLWIWIKTGVGGFFALLTTFGLGISTGGRALWRLPKDEIGIAGLLSVCYIIMHFVFAYVDMSWEASSMVMVAAMLSLTASLVPLVANQPAPEPKRWAWMREPKRLPSLTLPAGETS